MQLALKFWFDFETFVANYLYLVLFVLVVFVIMEVVPLSALFSNLPSLCFSSIPFLISIEAASNNLSRCILYSELPRR